MNNSDDILREKDDEDLFSNQSSEKHWAALEKKMSQPSKAQTPNKIIKTFFALAAIVVVIFIVYKVTNNKQVLTQKDMVADNVPSAIKPVVKGINVPYEDFSFDATLGDTLYTKNGSILIFPKNSVIDKNGKIVSGFINIKTREFNDGFDYSIAGIPMNYDSAGVQYKFISSAMIDIKAYQNNELLQVNPAAKPQLNLVSTNKEKNTNLYILDTLTGQWVNKGKEEIISVGKKGSDLAQQIAESLNNEYFEGEKEIVKPVAPQKASDLNPVINIEIDPLSFKELLVYDNLKFEVTDHSIAAVAEDSKTLWEDVDLQKGEISGTYKAVFSSKNKTVIYKVKPVLEGKDFEVAEKLYQEKMKEYNIVAQQRKTQDKEHLKKLKQNALKENMIIVQDSLAVKVAMAENNRIDALNNIITIRNKYIEKLQKRQDSLANDIELKQIAFERKQRDMQLDQSLMRSFKIDGFGYWNCDMPSLPQTVPYACEFKDQNAVKISFSQINLMAEGINRVMTFYSSNVALVTNKKHTAWTFANDSFYYLDENSFANIEWNNSKKTEVILKKYKGELNSYAELKAVIFTNKF